MREISSEVLVDAPPERVWSVLTDFASYSTWNPFIQSIVGEAKIGSRLRVILKGANGTALRFRPRVLVASPGKELRWMGRLVIPGLFDGEHTFTLVPNGEGTTFTQSEQFRGILVPLLWGRVWRETSPMFTRMNQALAARAEQTIP